MVSVKTEIIGDFWLYLLYRRIMRMAQNMKDCLQALRVSSQLMNGFIDSSAKKKKGSRDSTSIQIADLRVEYKGIWWRHFTSYTNGFFCKVYSASTNCTTNISNSNTNPVGDYSKGREDAYSKI